MAPVRVVRSVSRRIARQASPMVVSFWKAHSYAVPARLGQRAVYSWKVQVPQTSALERWALVSSSACHLLLFGDRRRGVGVRVRVGVGEEATALGLHSAA